MEINIKDKRYKTGELKTITITFKVPMMHPRFGVELHKTLHSFLVDLFSELAYNKYIPIKVDTKYFTGLADYEDMKAVRCHVIEARIDVTNKLTRVRKK